MADLAPRRPLEGFDLPLTAGAATLDAPPEAPMVSIAPFRGRAAAVAGMLGAGAALPGPGETVVLGDGSRLIWAGLDLWLLRGAGATP